MKKIISLTLIGLTLIAMLCSCSDKKEDFDKTTSSTSDQAIDKEDSASQKEKIKKAYIETLEANFYDYPDMGTLEEPDPFPHYGLYDFDKDNIPELLIWSIRIASSVDRDISVYKYNTEYEKVDYAGKMFEFVGHSNIREAADGRGIVIGTRDRFDNRIIKYTLNENNIIESQELESRLGDTDAEWKKMIESPKYFSEKEIERYFDDDYITSYFE